MRPNFRARGYTARWDHMAARFKQRYPLCGMRPDGRPPVMSRCHDEGRVTPAYAVDHGLGEIVGHAIAADRLAEFLAAAFADYQRSDPKPTETWAAVIAGRIVAEL